MRKSDLAILLILIAVSVSIILTQTPTLMSKTQNVSEPNETQTAITPANSTNITIATFNIQVFGQAKSSKPDVMAVLSRIARNFDVMAIQELRDENETTLPFYLSQINSLPGPAYAAISSPRLGRTSSKENYAFIYNTATLAFVQGSNYTFQDPPPGTSTDLFQREPFIARFRSAAGNFTFVLIDIHTDPDSTPQELDNMSKVLADAQAHFPDEKDFIILGDMNADCSYLRPVDNISLRDTAFTWLIPDGTDTTTKSTNCTYDRIIITEPTREDFTGKWGVFRFDQEYGLNQTQTEAVSDHYPAYAVFSTGKDTDG